MLNIFIKYYNIYIASGSVVCDKQDRNSHKSLIQYMSQPYQRGAAPNNNMAKRGGPNGNSNSTPYGSGSRSADEVNRGMLEQENDLRWMELGDQVSLLKSVG